MGKLTQPRPADHTDCWIENYVIACQFIFYKSGSLKHFIIAYPEQEIDMFDICISSLWSYESISGAMLDCDTQVTQCWD